jgi:hypothetical protein
MAKKQAVTNRQIEAALAQLQATLRKNRRNLRGDFFEKVLNSGKLGDRLLDPVEELIAIYQARAETDLRYHRVGVKRSRPWWETLEATGYDMSRVIGSAAETMPRGKGRWVTLVLFNSEQSFSDAELVEEYARLGLVPADPYSLAAANEDPDFAVEYRNCTHWNDQGVWNRLEFNDNAEADEGIRMTLTPSMDYYPPGLWYAGLDI